MSERLIQQSDDPAHDWKKINWCVQQIEQLKGQVSTLQAKVDSLTAQLTDSGVPFHPFRIYQFPRTLRNSAALDPATDWRKVRVRAGRVGRTVVEDTDLCDDNPDGPRYPLVDDNGDPITDITVPADCIAYWLWIEIVDGAPILKHSDDPEGEGWATFPKPDATHFPVGYVDSQTLKDNHRVIIRQLLRTDLVGPVMDVCVDDGNGGTTRVKFIVTGAVQAPDVETGETAEP